MKTGCFRKVLVVELLCVVSLLVALVVLRTLPEDAKELVPGIPLPIELPSLPPEVQEFLDRLMEGEAVVDSDDTGAYYAALSEQQQEAYADLLRGARDRRDAISVRATSDEDLEPALRAVCYDHPELFWLSGSCSYRLGKTRSTVKLDYTVGLDEIEDCQSSIDQACADYLALLPEGASTYDKVRIAYEYVINDCDYGFDSDQNQNVLSVFIDHQSVCAGYAKALQLLLAQVGVPCIYIQGNLTQNGEEHAWCQVSIDGVETLVDPTWGDPTYSESDAAAGINETLIYDYLCLTTAELERDGHFARKPEGIARCEARDFDWYVLHGLLLDTYDYATMDQLLCQALDEGKNTLAVKFTDEQAYRSAYAAASDSSLFLGEFGRRLRESGDGETTSYRYSGNDSLYVLRLWW